MGWQFCIDRGGTFTDVIARTPEGETRTHKLLSEQPGRRDDAALHAIRHLMGLAADDALHPHAIESVRIGTTVATNALLERKGERTLLVTTRGFADALRIGYQARPKLFALDIELPSMLYETVLEVDERVGARGEVLRPLDESAAREALQGAFNAGLRSVAIVFMHGYRFTAHEAAVASIAREVGFTEVCPSHEIAPMMKLVSRGDTTVADAYLTPILRRYVEQVRSDLSESADALLFMKSSGGLAPANRFRGKDALLSGPAGGVVGMIGAGRAAGFERLIGFDMGGTSTDVSHYAGELERSYERSLAGVRIVAPMMAVHTVAAGGGSVLHFDGARMRVGPESAGAVPGPAAYGAGGPLTVTDCHVALGRLRPEYFPKVFGEDGRQPLDVAAVHARFDALGDHVAEATGRRPTPEALADGFLAVAVDNMAAAIKKISVQRGYDVTEYTLCAFGGAGGQHACLVADALGIERVLLHPLAGVLSAYGIGQADLREVREQSVEAPLSKQTLRELVPVWAKLEASVRAPGASLFKRVALRYEGSSTALRVPAGDAESLRRAFDVAHRTRFGFTSPEKRLVVDAVHVESVVPGAQGRTLNRPRSRAQAVEHSVYFGGASMNTRFLHRDALEGTVEGPAVLLEETGTTIVEPGWSARRTERGDLLLERTTARERSSVATEVDPVHLEVFNNLFMNIAEQMGVVLEKTAASVNIKERLDFSCALFDRNGELIANAPHMPVHLGSMSESIKSLIRDRPELQAGQVYVMNAPYNGGTHLPDITVIRPVFDEGTILFFVAARGHHADVGGTAAGSAPAGSTHVDEEGVLLDNVLLVHDGRFLESDIQALLTGGPHPARNPAQNIADLKAQVAACARGEDELRRVIAHFGKDVVHAYMDHVKANAEEAVRRVIDVLTDGEFAYEMDDGSRVAVRIEVNHDTRSARIDFTGTSAQHPGNFNAPSAIAHAAVLYVFRCLVDDDIPLNAGCLKPLEVILPSPSMIDPRYPAAVVAGNVETSQVIVDALFGALGVMGAAQGTMNNVFFGNETHQYYETVCGGAGATPRGAGQSAVHTHMTNSRLTDPEVLEWRFPVRLEHFGVRRGSGGAGKHAGGDGTVRRLHFLEAMQVNVLSNRRRVPPYGMKGGEPGAPGYTQRIRGDAVESLPSSASCAVEAGDRLEIGTPGGGGYGAPS